MSVIFTEYILDAGNYLLDAIRARLSARNLEGLTNNRISGVSVTEEHPLVRITGASLGNQTLNWQGLLPAISVSDSQEVEVMTMLGHGQLEYVSISQAYIDAIRNTYPNQADRVNQGMVSDAQLTTIDGYITDAGGPVKAAVHEYFFEETMAISLWAHSMQEKQLIWQVLRSILYDIKLDLAKKHITNVTYTTDRGLINMNFGRVLHGQETIISLTNSFRNIEVFPDLADPGLALLPIAVSGDYTYIGSTKLLNIHEQTEIPRVPFNEPGN